MESQQNELLQKLFNLYKRRYEGEELEVKFNSSVLDLVESGDIEKGVYITFCIDNEIEPYFDGSKKGKESDNVIKKFSVPRKTKKSSGYESDGCGGSGSGGYIGSSC